MGFYTLGSLSREVVINEDSLISEVYKDFLDRTILERSITADSLYDTYYVYNERNQLSFVLTPEFQKSGFKEKFGYEYRYDEHGQMVKRMRPQCEEERFFYDSEGRVVYTEDAVERYKFFFYDNLGRQVIKGSCGNFNYHHYENVIMQTQEDGLFGTGYLYTQPWALTHASLDEVSFYDNYLFLTRSIATASPNYSSLTNSNAVNAKGLLTGNAVRTSSGNILLTVYYYDEKGRVTDKRETLLGGGFKRTLTTYSFTDKPLTETITLTTGNITTSIVKTYSYYNSNDKLESISIAFNNGTPVTVAEYAYNDLGQLSKLTRGGLAGATDYAYNIRGWITSITSLKFCEWLHYTDGWGTPYYSGNISTQQWMADNENVKRGYKFYYDGLGRMTKAEYGEGELLNTHVDRYTEWVKEYTSSNAIRKIERYGKKNGNSYGKIDNLRLYYSGMRLNKVKEDASPLTYTGAFDFVSTTVGEPTTRQYDYYKDGSLRWDANKGIALITYDRYNMPARVQFTNGNRTEYEYSATGQRLKTIYRTAVPNISVPIGSTIALNASNTLSVDSVNYFGDFIFENGLLTKYLFDGGYASITNGQPTWHYYYQDHLGNNRAVINHNGTLEQVNHYYPFGAIYGDVAYNDGFQKYKYNGKELDRMHGLNFYDYGARQYDPLLGMFTQMDPLAEKYYGVNPYAYCANNPVMLVDPDGNSPLSALIKVTAKQGVKAGIKTYVKNNIEYRLKNYMSDKMLKQFAKDVDDVMGTLDNSWWETALELVPVAGDIYGSTKFVKQVKKAYDKLQDLENKYVGKIYDALPKTERKKFVQNMRRRGVADARIDQAKGLDVGGEVKYKKGGKIDGHHTEKVSKNPDKMTDPRKIEFMEQSDHIKYHQQNGY